MLGAIGVIGGSGLYELDGLKELEELEVNTPFGKPSDAYFRGRLAGKEIIFLSRHGRGHRLLPSEINYRANIFGFKKLGARWLISVSAVGSMKEEIVPGHFVFPDQFIDLSKQRKQTFFGDGLVGHIPFSDPICPILSSHLAETAETLGISIHRGGTYICIEGPQFSTRAESQLYRSWGVDVIGMTNMPEARLAREAEIAYATMALATDYDCWHLSHDDVSIESVLAVISKNVDNARNTLKMAVENLNYQGKRTCDDVLKNAMITEKKCVPKEKLLELAPLLGSV